MSDAIDLDAYLGRIGYSGPREPTLGTLCALHALHPQSIAFENLDPLLGKRVRLDPPSVERKLVRDQRGGYCFEHNLLFGHALRALGFAVSDLAARVLWNRPEDAAPPRTHMLLRVEIDRRWFVADVGFGGLTLTAPLLLEPGVEQATPHEPFRIVTAGERFDMQARVRDAWKTLYRFDLEEQAPSDYEIANYYLSTAPESHFVTGLTAARTAPDRRHALSNTRLAVHHLNGPTERRQLGGVAALRDVLEETFGIALPREPGLDAALGRLFENS